MATTARKIFLAGLRDAYAMEKQAKDMMASQGKRLEDYPEVQERARRHELETDEQIERLERCLKQLNDSPSTLKNLATRTAAALQGALHDMVSDEIIKDTLTGFAFEHFEIAAYRQLIAMAKNLGEEKIASTLRLSLVVEEAMAKWMNEHLEKTVDQFVAQTARRAAA
jgi:ferritin-like metal-binding protein YciE